ncbi:MAG TPA: acyl carrier protein [Blastocatellia bacterium]|nr:acyl carrier protein [Blastocatellia bacterium]
MNKREFLSLVEDVIEADPGTIQGTETLEELGWNSLSVLGFIAAMDERFELAISPKELGKCKTVSDLMALLGDRVSAD